MVVALIALAIRLYGLTSRPLWDDEGWSLRLMLAQDGHPWQTFVASVQDFTPPLHYVLLNLIAHLTPPGLEMLRLPSAIAGALAAGVMAHFAARLSGRTSVGLLAGGLLATNIPQVLHSQEARVYPFLTLLAVLSMYGAVGFVRGWRERWLYVPATILMLYAHNFAVFLFAPQCLYALVHLLRERWTTGTFSREALRLPLAQAIVVAAWIPLLIAFLLISGQHQVPTWWATGAGDFGPVAWARLLAGMTVRSWFGAAAWGLLLTFAIWQHGPWRTKRRQLAERPRDGVDVFWIGGGWVLGVLVMSCALTALSSVESFGSVKYHTLAIPGLCLMVCSTLVRLRPRMQWAVAALLPVALGAVELPAYSQKYRLPRLDLASVKVERATPSSLYLVGNYYRAMNFHLRSLAPRLGTDEWRRWRAGFAEGDLRHRSIDGSTKFASTYYSEKMMPELVAYMEVGFVEDPARSRLEKARRAVDASRGSYWVVASGLPEEQAVLNALAADSARCPRARRDSLPDVWLLHCERASAAWRGNTAVRAASGLSY